VPRVCVCLGETAGVLHSMELSMAVEASGLHATVLASSPAEAEAWRVCRSSESEVTILARASITIYGHITLDSTPSLR